MGAGGQKGRKRRVQQRTVTLLWPNPVYRSLSDTTAVWRTQTTQITPPVGQSGQEVYHHVGCVCSSTCLIYMKICPLPLTKAVKSVVLPAAVVVNNNQYASVCLLFLPDVVEVFRSKISGTSRLTKAESKKRIILLVKKVKEWERGSV